MRKIYSLTRDFLINHRKLGCFITTVAFLLSAFAVRYFGTFFSAAAFGFSICALMRLYTFGYGKIPLIMKDTTWRIYKRKYSADEVEEKYSEMYIKRASIYFMCCIASSVIWIVWEIVCILLD